MSWHTAKTARRGWQFQSCSLPRQYNSPLNKHYFLIYVHNSLAFYGLFLHILLSDCQKHSFYNHLTTERFYVKFCVSVVIWLLWLVHILCGNEFDRSVSDEFHKWYWMVPNWNFWPSSLSTYTQAYLICIASRKCQTIFVESWTIK